METPNPGHCILVLSDGTKAIVDSEDYPLVSVYNWCPDVRPNGIVYVRRNLRIEGRKSTQLLHRLIMGETNPSIKVDHRDHDGLNNRRSNLRQCTQAQNVFNNRNLPSRKRGGVFSSKFKGVYWNKKLNKWVARIGIGGKSRHITQSTDEIIAARAYDKAAVINFGQFAYVNFPEENGSAKD